MSLPLNPLPEPSDSLPEPSPIASPDFGIVSAPVQLSPLESLPPIPREPRFPAWSWWDTLAVLGFTIFAVFLFSIVALAIARHFPAYRQMPLTDLATDARIVVGSQAAAYPLVLVFIYMLVRSRSRQRFRDAIHWNWPGITAPAFFVGGALLAVDRRKLVKLSAHPQVVAHGQLLPQCLQRLPAGGLWHVAGAVDGGAVLPGHAVSR